MGLEGETDVRGGELGPRQSQESLPDGRGRSHTARCRLCQCCSVGVGCIDGGIVCQGDDQHV